MRASLACGRPRDCRRELFQILSSSQPADQEGEMKQLVFVGTLLVAGAMSAVLAGAQTGARPTSKPTPAQADQVPTQAMTLGTVTISRPVKADDQPLKPGTYQVRLTGDPLKPAIGETPNLEQWVEFLQGGKVKGKAVASIVPQGEIGQIAKGPRPAAGGSRVDLLKGNDYVRVWINRSGNNYLIHLPTAG